MNTLEVPIYWEQFEPQQDHFALNYSIFGLMARISAKLKFEGKLQALFEDPEVHTQVLDFGVWKATVSYGLPQFGAGNPPAGNMTPDGAAMVAQLGPDEFLVTAVHAALTSSLLSNR